MYLSSTESRNYQNRVRAELRLRAYELAYAAGRRFAQIVNERGTIVDILEVTG